MPDLTPLQARAHLAVDVAVRGMPADDYCPKRGGGELRRVDCEYCIGEVAANAVLEAVEPLIRASVLEPFEELFSGGPDTACRTTWHHDPFADPALQVPPVECVEVPMADLRAAFAAAKHDPHQFDPPRPYRAPTAGDPGTGHGPGVIPPPFPPDLDPEAQRGGLINYWQARGYPRAGDLCALPDCGHRADQHGKTDGRGCVGCVPASPCPGFVYSAHPPLPPGRTR